MRIKIQYFLSLLVRNSRKGAWRGHTVTDMLNRLLI